MASANYDSKNSRWVLLWKQPAPDGKYSYGRKRITDKTYPSMGARDQKRTKKQMEAQAEQLEAAAQGQANNAPIATPAWQDLQRVQKVCKSEAQKGVKDARAIVRKFAKWLQDTHPTMLVADIDANTMAEYTANLMRSIGMATNTAKQHLRRIKWVLQRKGDQQPAWSVKDLLSDYAANEEVFSREEISQDEFAFIMHGILTGEFDRRNKDDGKTALNVFALFFFGICTSWRRGDIVSKTWEDCYLPELTDKAEDYGTIRNRHHKTKNKSGAVSTIRLTRVARVLLDALKECNGDSKTIIQLNNPQYHCDKIFEKLHKKFGKERMQRGTQTASCVSYHSLRTTAISYNIKAGLQESLVCSLAGHAPANIERKHYIKYSPDDYRLCVRSLEDGFVLPVYDKIKHDRDKIKPIFGGVLEAIRLADSYAVDYSKFEDKREVKMVVDKLRRAGFFAALQSMPISYHDIKLAFEHLRA